MPPNREVPCRIALGKFLFSPRARHFIRVVSESKGNISLSVKDVVTIRYSKAVSMMVVMAIHFAFDDMKALLDLPLNFLALAMDTFSCEVHEPSGAIITPKVRRASFGSRLLM